MRIKNLMKLLGARCTGMALLILSVMCISCAQIEIKDEEVCGDKGELGASCFHTLKEDVRRLTKPEWDKERFGMLCMKVGSFLDFKSEIEKLCSITDRCTQEQKEALDEFFSRINKFERSQD